jgi:PKD repeat protein
MTVIVLDTIPPVADAGKNRTVMAGTEVTLDGSGSTDNIGIQFYTWRFAYAGVDHEMYGETTTFAFDEAGGYEITLTVTDARSLEDENAIVITVNPTEVTWRLGPFADQDGNPIEGAEVTVFLNDTRHVVLTDGEGWLEIEIPWIDLVPPAQVKAAKDGWVDLEFDIDLDDEGSPTGDIPPMEKRKSEDSPGAGAALALIAIIGAIVLLYTRRGRVG